MDEQALRKRVNRIVGVVLATAFVGTAAWSATSDDHDRGGDAVQDDPSDSVERERLVEAFLRQRYLDSLDDAVIAIPPTYDLPAPETTVPPVPIERMTVTVDADGCSVTRSAIPEEGASRLSWLVRDADGFEVMQRTATADEHLRYEEPGEYTVVMQALGDAGYEEISDPVTIHC